MKTTHVIAAITTTDGSLVQGRALCGFTADRAPGDWPDGHNWVSVVDVWTEHGTIVYATPAANRPKENNKPCDVCLRVVTYLKYGITPEIIPEF